MTRRALLFFLALGMLLAPGCGKKGPVQAPLVRIPQKVEDFKAFQRGDKLRLEWKLPVTYSDGTPFSKPVDVEIWLVKEEPPALPLPAAEKEQAAKKPETAAAKPAQAEEKAPAPVAAIPPPEIKQAQTETPPAAPPEKAPAQAQAAAAQTDKTQAQAAQATTTQAAPAPVQTLESPEGVSVSGEMPLEMFKDKAVLASSVPTDFLAQPPKAPELASLSQSYEYALDLGQLKSRYTFAVCVKDHRKKYSDYSSRITLAPKIMTQPPRNLKATLYPEKIVLSWEPPAANIDSSPSVAVPGYSVFRSRGSDLPEIMNKWSLVKETEFVDREFEFGVIYRYTVRAALNEAPPRLESADSPVVEITPKDTFPPAAPSGLKTIAGAGFISLSWESNQETDMAGYRVWRRTQAEEEFRLLTEAPILETNYSDRSVQSGVHYLYALSALDKSGNESRKAKAVSETARSPRP
jgi:fibronectin type 3 domain-containing protein